MQRVALPAGTHSCACGTTCKGKCCCARREAARDTADPARPASLQAGCQVAPTRHFPPPFQPIGLRLEELRAHEQAWSDFLDAMPEPESGLSFFLDESILHLSNFDTPPDPPPDRLIRL